VGVLTAGLAAVVETPAATSTGSAALDRFLAETRTMTAAFHQESWSADEELLETAAGEFALQRPDQFLWRYEVPLEQLIVADGERLWMYDVELDQVTVTPLDSPAASSPAMLLSGDAGARESFAVTESFAADGIEWVRLVPTLGDTDFQSVLIGFRNGDLTGLEMVDGLNQTTRIEFLDVVVNPELDPDLFEFVPPADAALIGEP
jgi:outer membrane lipoprotein carrier protein